MDMGEEGKSFRREERREPPLEPLSVWNGSAVPPSGWTVKARILAVSTPEELAWIARKVNGDLPQQPDGDQPDAFEGVTICLTADMDLGGREWEPIGKDMNHPFKGRFDGRGHRIAGLRITRDDVRLAGLFGFAYFEAVIRNVAIVDCQIRTVVRKGFIGYAAPVCAYGFGDIWNCCTSGQVYVACEGRTATAGGVGGGNLICDCYAACQVEASSARHAFAGGISGQFTEIISCYSTGSVRAVSRLSLGFAFAGGIGANINNTGIMHCLALNKDGITVAAAVGKAEVGRVFGTVSRQILVVHERNYASPLVRLGQESSEGISYPSPVNEAGGKDGEAWDGTNYRWSEAFEADAFPFHLPLLRTTDGKGYVGGISTQPSAALPWADYLPCRGNEAGN